MENETLSEESLNTTKSVPKFSENKLIHLKYKGIEINLNEDGWFNATKAAEIYGKRPAEWLRLPETERYIDALCAFHKVGKSHFIKTKRGKNVGGTWLYPRLAVPFARWCDIDFAIWCDDQIDKILRGSHPHFDWKRMRHEATSSYRVMGAVLQLVRQNDGKKTQHFHYANEAKLVNWAITGEYKKLNREQLQAEELDLLAKLEERNTVLLGVGLTRDERKLALSKFVTDFNAPMLDAATL